jgi:uncharacterized protein
MRPPRLGLPNLGLGIGLRTCHYAYILSQWPEIDWFEVISENYMDSLGRPRHVLEQVIGHYPVVMHGVSLSIGSTDPLNRDYLRRLRALAEWVHPAWISDHLCWTGVTGLNTHDLLPLPLNEATLRHVVERIHVVQDILERRIVLENPSTYVGFSGSTMPEWEFMSRMAEDADCGLLLDVNNVYVSAINHEYDPADYIAAVPPERIVQIHLAGHTNLGTHIIDTHDGRVVDPVWQLYRAAHQKTGGVSTLLEWDAQIPPFSVVHEEVLKARRYIGPEAPESPPTVGAAGGIEESATQPQPLHWIHAEVL